MSFEHFNNVNYLNTENETNCHTLDLWIPGFKPLPEMAQSKYWVIFVHGGAWHDPYIKSSFARPAVTKLLDSPFKHNIAGIASLNYRLSPHPAHLTCPSIPDDNSRNAMHPDHSNDVFDALMYLQHRFQFNHRYMIVGHSCGATIAFQNVMPRAAPEQGSNNDGVRSQLVHPQAIVGIAGIYDLALLCKMDPYPPACQEFITLAFGAENKWKAASPVSEPYEHSWKDGKVVVLALCSEDQYVAPAQREVMAKNLQKWAEVDDHCLKLVTVAGRHDDAWEIGEGMASCAREAMSLLLERKQLYSERNIDPTN